MNNNPDVPDGWAMPDDLAKKVSEALNKKLLSPEGELAGAAGEGEGLARSDLRGW